MDETRKKILCIEDHPETCEMITVLLKDTKVISAKSKAEALLWIIKEKFDLYLLDYHLQDGTCLDVCSFIRRFDSTTPILFCTGDDFITDTQVKAIGAQSLIKKGVTFVDELPSEVTRLLQHPCREEPAFDS